MLWPFSFCRVARVYDEHLWAKDQDNTNVQVGAMEMLWKWELRETVYLQHANSAGYCYHLFIASIQSN